MTEPEPVVPVPYDDLPQEERDRIEAEEALDWWYSQ